jgi:hypothetical protein
MPVWIYLTDAVIEILELAVQAIMAPAWVRRRLGRWRDLDLSSEPGRVRHFHRMVLKAELSKSSR